jgi:hypothetical protein
MRNLTSLSLLATLALSGCWWTTPAHDDGDEAFVAQAIEAILGRKPRGSAEVRALADLVPTYGREGVVEVLFEQPEYVAYWSGVLADDLQVQRAGAMQVHADCTAPALLPESMSGSLASHLATAKPSEPFCTWVPDRPRSSFDESIFEKAVDQALANYPFPTLDKQPVPKPMDEAEARMPYKGLGFPLKPSKEIDLEREGSWATNDDLSADDLKGKVTRLDLKRWWDTRQKIGDWECPPFNLTDVIEASVRADRLDAMYRGYLPVLATFPGTDVEDELRADLGATFLDVYLDRDPTCMTCHTATFSKTDARPVNANWDRFDPVWYGLPVPLDAEGTVFSHTLSSGDFVYGGDGGERARGGVNAFFRSDNHTSGGLRPWGMDEVCVTNPARGFAGFTEELPADPEGGAAVLAGLGPSSELGVLDLVGAISDGVGTLDTLELATPDWASHRSLRGADPAPADPGCTICHGSNPAAPSLAEITPVMTDTRLFSIIRNGSGRMPAWVPDDDEAWDAVEWVRQTYRPTPALQFKDRRHGLVMLLAANLVNQVADEVLGENFVMDHSFPRNPDQARALSSLTMVLLRDFSLKAVLREIVLSEGFNRQPPEEPGTLPYVLDMLPYPEAEVSPVVSPVPLGADANSEGDFVHKHSPSGLLHQVHHALGWPAPGLAGYPDAWPDAALMPALGRYTSRGQREREQFNPDTFLTWEQSVASCAKPAAVHARDVALAPGVAADPTDLVGPEDWLDWIDVLAEDGAIRGDSWKELAIAVKDRLLADPLLEAEEEMLLKELWEADLGDKPAGSPEAALREYCGVLLASPHFVLRGVRLADALPAALPEPSCLPGEICGEDELYAFYEEQLKGLNLPPDPNGKD